MRQSYNQYQDHLDEKPLLKRHHFADIHIAILTACRLPWSHLPDNKTMNVSRFALGIFLHSLDSLSFGSRPRYLISLCLRSKALSEKNPVDPSTVPGPVLIPDIDISVSESEARPERRTDSHHHLPGTLQIDVEDNTGVPVLNPLPSPEDHVVLTNGSSGQMGVRAASGAGTVQIVVPDGGTVGIRRTDQGVPPKIRATVIEKYRIIISDWDNLYAWGTHRIPISGRGAPGDAVPPPARGKWKIDLNGNYSET